MSVTDEQVEAWYRRALEDRDVEAVLALGAAYVSRGGAQARDAAEDWFQYATDLDSGVDLLWRITVIYSGTLRLEPAERWMRRAVTAEWTDCEYVVEPTVFPFYDAWDDKSIHGQVFAVQVSATPPEAARVALEAASSRFMLVNENGEETDGEYGGLYTPNFVHDVRDHAEGVWLMMDCKDNVMPLMARTDIRILVEELRSAEAVSGRIQMPSDEVLRS